MIGSVLDKYRVLQKVGEGGMATVYGGEHLTLGRKVAIKILHPHLSCNTRNRIRFAREARAIEHLRHENILRIFDYSGERAQDCYIVTEFVNGHTLTALVEQFGRLPSEICIHIGIRLAEALAYAHEEGVLHRDLKPENVMLRDDGLIKLMDFGIARFLDESQVTMTGALVGSPAFMSPEQAREADLDARSDLFSLGTMLFRLCTGHLPFSGSNPSLILKNIIDGNRAEVTELTPSASPGLAEVIERLLQTDRIARFDDARQVAEALRAALEQVSIQESDADWGLKSWLDEPDNYAARLNEHLKLVLMRNSKEKLADGQQIEALRMLNRLLAIDEDNEEVLELIQALPSESDHGAGRPIWPALIAAGLGLAALVSLAVLQPWASTDVSTEQSEPPANADIENETPSSSPQVMPPAVPVSRTVDTDTPTVAIAAPKSVERPSSPRVELPKRPTPKPDVVKEPIAAVVSSPVKKAYLAVRVLNGYGKVYINGEPTQWSTNNPIPLAVEPGNISVSVRHQLAEPLEFDVSISPGETLRKEVEFSFLPLGVSVPESWSKRCRVSVKGKELGDLQSLGYATQVERDLDGPSQIELDCPGSGTIVHKISRAMMSRREITLPEPG